MKLFTQKNSALFILLLCFSNAWSQQEYYFTNTVNNPYTVNPAASGMASVIHLETSARMQWLGYNGSPRTMLLTGNGQLKTKGNQARSSFNEEGKTFNSNPVRSTGIIKHIVGGKAMNDAIGPFAKTSVYGSYAIHLPFSKKLNFGLGIGLGWSNFRIDQDRINLHQEDDATYNQFLTASSSQNFLDANAGIVLYGEKFFGGLSMSQVLKNKANFGGIETGSYFERHYFLVMKYKVKVNEDFNIEPSVVAKYVKSAPFVFDLGARILYHDAAWFGIQYRTNNAFNIQVGANLIKNFYLSYAYEFSNGPLNISRNGTHEINLGIYIGKKRNTKAELDEEEKI